MKHIQFINQLGQVISEDASAIFGTFFRGAVREAFANVMAEEITALCGAPYSRGEKTDYRRAGSAPGAVVIEGEAMERPRVREVLAGGSTVEKPLSTYQAAKDYQSDQIQEAILRAFQAGVSTTSVQEAIDWDKGASSAQVSRLWSVEGAKRLEALRARPLGEEKWLGLMLDGIHLSAELTGVVALGITEDGRKVILDLQIGSSENLEICKDLVTRLVERGFGPGIGQRLLVVIDGSKPLKKAVKGKWSDAVIQRCLVHKERNIRAKLSSKHHRELARLFKQLRLAQGIEEATKALENLRAFLKAKSAQALERLEEAGDEELIAFHLLNLPNTLNVTFLSTNNIENAFLNTRRKIKRVTRWREDSQQASNWLAYALLEAEKGFRRISGHKELPQLVEALKVPTQS